MCVRVRVLVFVFLFAGRIDQLIHLTDLVVGMFSRSKSESESEVYVCHLERRSAFLCAHFLRGTQAGLERHVHARTNIIYMYIRRN